VVGKFKFIGSSAATGDGALSVFHMRQVNLQQAQGATTTITTTTTTTTAVVGAA
jgi:hypothetical protein